jgi:hypothetical protein
MHILFHNNFYVEEKKIWNLGIDINCENSSGTFYLIKICWACYLTNVRNINMRSYQDLANFFIRSHVIWGKRQMT